jgi:cell wall-associated NlpC family hydrolase
MEEYIGIPFQKNGSDRNGIDCWRLIVLVYRERLGIDLPDFAGVYVDGSLASLKKVSRMIRDEKQAWQRVDRPLPYDVILLRTGDMVYHVGLVIDRKRMLHVMEGIDSTIEEFTGLQWRQKVEGYYRYKGVSCKIGKS